MAGPLPPNPCCCDPSPSPHTLSLPLSLLPACLSTLSLLSTLGPLPLCPAPQVSSRTGAGVPEAVGAIRRERRGRDVFVMGAANVGKSAFIRALMK